MATAPGRQAAAYTQLGKDGSTSSTPWSRTRRTSLLALLLCAVAAFTYIQQHPSTHSVITSNLPFVSRHSAWPSYFDPHRLALIDDVCRASARGPTPTSDMSIAHLISVHHDESIISLGMLLQEMYDPVDLFVIHVKAGIESAHLAPVQRAFASCANVVFVPDEERIAAGYASWEVVEMEMILMRVALRQAMQWTYAIMVDGASWPTMLTEERRDWFRARPANTSQTFYRTEEGGLLTICPGPVCNRSASKCVDEACTKWTLTPNGAPVARASQWNRFTRELVTWILTSPEVDPWITFFKGSIKTPDEHFFATMHWVSPFRDQDDSVADYVYTDWANSKHCLWWPNPRPVQSPCYLSVMDIPNVIQSGKPFMRKIASGDGNLRRALPMSVKPPKGLPVWDEGS